MLDKIVLSKSWRDGFADIMNDSCEHTGHILARVHGRGIVPVDALFCRGSELHAMPEDPKEKEQLLEFMHNCYTIAQADSGAYAILDSHSHGRKFGEIIQPYDPYWTITPTGQYRPGAVVADRFFVSRLHESGDDLEFEKRARVYAKHQVPFFHLFLHPQYGTENQPMTKEKVQCTMYAYAPHELGKVREVPIVSES